jgi:GntP family gluconate:H+ symporter
VVNLLIFFLAFFLDFFELSFIVVPLIGPVAEKMGIDLIWFGVLLGVNMQTSFMHPPFGFALFYLRSVAPIRAYTDRLTKQSIEPVTTMQIYWGAVPFVLIQVVMVGLIIAFPGIVSSGLDKEEKVDLDKVQMEMSSGLRGAAPAASAAASGAAAPETIPGPEATPTPAEADKSADDEQKKIDDLFKK